jgi:hypothetical protein
MQLKLVAKFITETLVILTILGTLLVTLAAFGGV